MKQVVDPLELEQLLVGALLGERSLVEDQDLVCHAWGANART